MGLVKRKFGWQANCTEWRFDVPAGMCEAGWKFTVRLRFKCRSTPIQPDLPTQLLFWYCLILKLKALQPFKMLGPVYPMTQNIIPEALNHQQHQSENLKSHHTFHPNGLLHDIHKWLLTCLTTLLIFTASTVQDLPHQSPPAVKVFLWHKN